MVQYRIFPEHKLYVICIWGEPTAEDIQKQRQKIRASIDLSKNYDAILEVTHIKRWFTNKEIHAFSKSLSDALFSGKKLAIIASSDIAYGINRMFESIVDSESPLQVATFRESDSALTWLGRDGIDIESIFKEIMGEEQ